MNTQTQEALKMAIAQIEWADHLHDWHDGLLDALTACKEALAQPSVAQLNNEYLRDTHVEGLSQPAQEPVARIELFNLLTKNGAFAIKEEWLWNVRYVNSKGLIKHFPNEYPSEKKYAVQSAKYWADFLNCQIAEVDNRSSK